MPSPLRIGFLGCGYIADFHAAMLADCDEPHVIGDVFDPDGDRRATFAAKWSAHAVGDADAVIERSDAVFVCTWTSEHAEMVRRIAARGRHVFCEKPLAFDAATAASMAAEIRAAGIVDAVGLILRTSPAMLWLREMLRDPVSGRLMNIVFRDDQYIPTQGVYASSWRADPELAGSGALLEHSIHDVDILDWLAGPIVRVAAEQSFFHDIHGIEDSVSAVLRFESGASAVLSSVWHDVLSRPSQRRIEVFCERALYTVEGEFFGPVRWDRDGDAGAMEGVELDGWLKARDIAIAWPESRFLTAIRTGGRATPAFEDAVRAHHIVDAIYRSARAAGTAVAVPTA